MPEPVLLHAKDANIKDKEVCASKDHSAEDLIVDPQTKGLANVFIYFWKKPKLIHPDLVEPKEPNAAVRYKDFRFNIEHLPVGEHKLQIWHERSGALEKDFKITVTAGEPVELPVMNIDINRLRKPDPVK